MEFDKKEIDMIFEKFLKDSATVINWRRLNPINKVNPSYENRIFLELKYLFDLDANLSMNNFKINFIKKVYTSKTCKENIIKMIYFFIFKDEINSKEDIENKVNDIINLVKKMKDSDLPLPKSYLIEKLKKMKMIKLVKTNPGDMLNQTDDDIVNELLTEKEKFKQIEKNRKDKSHNKDSLKHFYELQKSTIDNANEIINQAEGIKPITESELKKLKKCENFLKKSSDEDLSEKTFDSYVKETRNEVKKVISERLKKSTFGAKAPSSKKVLAKILDLF